MDNYVGSLPKINLSDDPFSNLHDATMESIAEIVIRAWLENLHGSGSSSTLFNLYEDDEDDSMDYEDGLE